MSLAVTPHGGGVAFEVRVIPRATRPGIAGVRDGRLLVRVGAAPVEGQANEAVVKLLAKELGVPRGAVELLAGERSRTKRVAVGGLAAADLAERWQEDA